MAYTLEKRNEQGNGELCIIIFLQQISPFAIHSHTKIQLCYNQLNITYDFDSHSEQNVSQNAD